MKTVNYYVDVVALVLLVVGGLNWGFVGLFHYDFVAAIFGEASVVTRVVYALVGFAAVYGAYYIYRVKCCKCEKQ